MYQQDETRGKVYMEDIVMREGDWDSKITNKVKEGAVV